MNLRGIFDFLLRRAAPPAPLRFDDSTSVVPGMMVVCLADGWNNSISADGHLGPASPGPHPVKGCVYGVMQVGKAECGAIALHLDGYPSCWYRAAWFKPVRTTNISVFRDLLTPSDADRIALAALDGRAVEPVR